jgi:hypothetical protein
MNTSVSLVIHSNSFLNPNTSFEGSSEDIPDSPMAAFRYFYLPIHGYFSISVCMFGIVANIANIIVLTR